MRKNPMLVALPLMGVTLMGFTNRLAAEEPQESNNFGWFFVCLGLLLLIPLIWWLRRQAGEDQADSHAATGHDQHSRAMETTPVGSLAQHTADSGAATRSAPVVAIPTPATPEPPPAPPAPEPAPPPPTRATTAAKPDDLKVIEGIGPKIAGILNAAGIVTFAQLADTPVDRLDEILREANLRNIADPSTWPEQAALAAKGDWNAFKQLTDQLKGGRRA